MDARKQKQIVNRIEAHLRKTARRMVRFDTLDETLQYLVDSFFRQFPCDYMSIIITENQQLNPRVKKGEAKLLEASFPIGVSDCLPRIFEEPLCSFDVIMDKDKCAVLSHLTEEKFQSWFTIPIRPEEGNALGLCLIGFRTFVPLVLEGSKLFEEYGKDIATAIELAIRKESEHSKAQGLEWLRENAYLAGSSIEQIVGKIVERAGKGTNAKGAAIFLYVASSNSLWLQPPVFGDVQLNPMLELNERYDLKQTFPYLEKSGGTEVTIPLIVNVRMVGVLHVIHETGSSFTSENVEYLQFLGAHVSTLIENAKLYSDERESKSRLESYMNQQQEMVKQTLVDEGFGGITAFLSGMLNCSVLLFDRFFHLSAQSVLAKDEPIRENLLQTVKREKKELMRSGKTEHWLAEPGHDQIGMWRVIAGGDTVGYLGLVFPRERLDIVLRMTLNHALNVYAVQFIKQKLVLDVREQVKDSFVNQLLVENIEDKGKILEYANLLNWNITQPHSIGIFSFVFDKELQSVNLLEEDAKKNWLWELVRDHCAKREPGIFLTRKDGCYLAIVPQDSVRGDFWKTFHERIQRLIKSEMDHVSVYIGISQESRQIEDYYFCYKQAQKTLTILCNRFPQKGYMIFHQLGSYSVLYQLGDPVVVPLFIKTYLEPLLQHGNGKNRDLFDTLRVYLETNGNIKDTANELFIHRSSLKYRLEKIRQIIDLDIDEAEQRFNLMLAYKLFDLFHTNE